jgi:hypothetical protein
MINPCLAARRKGIGTSLGSMPALGEDEHGPIGSVKNLLLTAPLAALLWEAYWRAMTVDLRISSHAVV